MNTPAELSSEATIPLSTLDPEAPLEELPWLDEAIGEARIVAIGESSHYNEEYALLRDRLLRYLVLRHGFTAVVQESGFLEGELVDEWVRGGADSDIGSVLANGLTALMGLWRPMRAQLEWMREHNKTSSRPLRFYGVDLPSSQISLLPSLDALGDYLARVDPDYRMDPELRATAEEFAVSSPFTMARAFGNYGDLAVACRDALSAGLSELDTRMAALRFEYVERGGRAAYARARRVLRLAIAQDAMYRELAAGRTDGTRSSLRDAEMAETIEWILSSEERIVFLAHNGHLQRCPIELPGMMAPANTVGMHLAERYGEDYVPIGTTSGAGEVLGDEFFSGNFFAPLEAPRQGSLDALLETGPRGPFVLNPHGLSEVDTEALRAVTEQRIGAYYGSIDPMAAYDLIAHLPWVSGAEPDEDAVANAPSDVREAVASYRATRNRG